MMPQLSFDNSNFYLDGKKTYLNSGEFHYFRVPRADWKKRMRLLRESGANSLATYIPWRVHEPEDGVFRLDCGDGVTDLSAFLECAAEENLLVTVRPGPYVYSEMVACGLPDWLLAKHPEIMAVDRHGKKLSDFSVSYQHPVFLKYAKRFFDFIIPAVARHQTDRGGAVAMFQLDNELTGIHFWFGGMDFNAEAMEFGREDGRYARFLAARHGSVARVNRLYGTHAASFAELTPADEPASGIEKVRWNRDYYDFYISAAADYLEILAAWSKELGITVPLCHNSASPTMDASFREAKRRFGNKLLLGSDHYYMLNQSWPQNNPTPQYLARCFMSLELLRILGNPPSVLEAQYGNISDWPTVAPEDLELALAAHIAMGMRGHNGYIFTGGPNPPGDGWSGPVYDYGAPVAADGTPRPTYDALKRIGKFLADHPELADDEGEYETRVLAPWDLLDSDDLTSSAADDHCAVPAELKADFLRGTVSIGFASNLAQRFVNPDDDGWMSDFSTPLEVTSCGVMSQKYQRKLAEFLRAGGRVLLTPCLPSLDENLEPCTILADAIGGAANGARLSGDPYGTCAILGIEPVFGTRQKFPAESVPEGAEVIGRTTAGNRCISFDVKVGNGQLIWLGMSFQLAMKEHIEMWSSLFARLGAERRWTCSNPWLVCSRRRTPRGTLIFVSNPGSSRQHADCSYRDDAGNLHEFPALELGAMEYRTFYVKTR